MRTVQLFFSSYRCESSATRRRVSDLPARDSGKIKLPFVEKGTAAKTKQKDDSSLRRFECSILALTVAVQSYRRKVLFLHRSTSVPVRRYPLAQYCIRNSLVFVYAFSDPGSIRMDTEGEPAPSVLCPDGNHWDTAEVLGDSATRSSLVLAVPGGTSKVKPALLFLTSGSNRRRGYANKGLFHWSQL